jgi:hypothetical protein
MMNMYAGEMHTALWFNLEGGQTGAYAVDGEGKFTSIVSAEE